MELQKEERTRNGAEVRGRNLSQFSDFPTFFFPNLWEVKARRRGGELGGAKGDRGGGGGIEEEKGKKNRRERRATIKRVLSFAV